MEIHEFNKSLDFGQAAETFVAAYYKGILERLSGLKADFLFLKPDSYRGEGLELKADGFISPNMFVERWSKTHATQPGYSDKLIALENPKAGRMWQARNNGTKYYAYFLPMYAKIIFFETEALITVAEGLVKARNIDLTATINKDGRGGFYQSSGWLIPRMVLEKYALKVRDLRQSVEGGLGIEITPKGAVYTLDGVDYNFPVRGTPIFDMRWKPFSSEGK